MKKGFRYLMICLSFLSLIFYNITVSAKTVGDLKNELTKEEKELSESQKKQASLSVLKQN